jgi:hypothetical protein
MVSKKNAALAPFLPPIGDKWFDDWVTPQRTAAIARILGAVGKSTDDEVQLATDIFEAYVSTSSQLDLYERSKAAKRLEKVKSIRKAVETQAALISADSYLSAAICKDVGLIRPPPIGELRIQLRSLEIQLSSLAKEWRTKIDLPTELSGRRPSEPEWLAGVSLPLVYERHFHSPAGRSRNAEGTPGGPTVRFVGATLRELSIPYSPESIVRAFTRLRRQRDKERARREAA